MIGNWWAIMQRTKMLNALTAGYEQVAVVFPFIVAAPRFFSGQIPLGGLTQTAGAFGRVQDALSWFIGRYPDLAQWHAIVERLTTFHRAVVAARAAFGTGLELTDAPEGVGADARHQHRAAERNEAPYRRPISCWTWPIGCHQRPFRVRQVHFVPRAGWHLAVRPWPGAAATERCLFLPQRPYIPLGTLRHVITYPHPHDTYSREDVERALVDAGLGQFVPRLDEDENWAQRLSGGEQQRVALARALLAKPDWLFLDEATASLDPEAEADLYRTLKARLPNTTMVSIAHRPSVAAFHDGTGAAPRGRQDRRTGADRTGGCERRRRMIPARKLAD